MDVDSPPIEEEKTGNESRKVHVNLSTGNYIFSIDRVSLGAGDLIVTRRGLEEILRVRPLHDCGVYYEAVGGVFLENQIFGYGKKYS